MCQEGGSSSVSKAHGASSLQKSKSAPKAPGNRGPSLEKLGWWLAGFNQDAQGILRTRAEPLQLWGGYNDPYDAAFKAAGTGAVAQKFPFEYDHISYVVWMWKGENINMGYGSEVGFYSQKVPLAQAGFQWNADSKDPNLPLMSTSVDHKTSKVASFAPSTPQVWVWAWNPNMGSWDPANADANAADCTPGLRLPSQVLISTTRSATAPTSHLNRPGPSITTRTPPASITECGWKAEMKRLASAAMSLILIELLSSCSMISPPGVPLLDDSGEQADTQMRLVENAIKDRDADALEELFSNSAREQATDLKSGLDYFLSTFDSGSITWESTGVGSTSETEGLKETTVLFCNYSVVADGEKYELFFVYYPVNEIVDPENVGIFALGVAPYEEDSFTASGEPKPFLQWARQFKLKDHVTSGDPGVYVPQS